jgi:hypothetical protein
MTGITHDRIRAARVAQEFAARLNEILPPGFSAVPGEDYVRVDAPDGLGGIGWVGAVDQELSDADAGYHGAAWNVLSGAQDIVSETTKVPWPKAASARLDLALPGSRIERDVLLTWFGDEADPVLRLRPIVLCPEDTRR